MQSVSLRYYNTSYHKFEEKMTWQLSHVINIKQQTANQTRLFYLLFRYIKKSQTFSQAYWIGDDSSVTFRVVKNNNNNANDKWKRKGLQPDITTDTILNLFNNNDTNQLELKYIQWKYNHRYDTFIWTGTNCFSYLSI